MTRHALTGQAMAYLYRLCVEIDSRRVGSPGNWLATDFFAETIASFGFEAETPRFNCIDWIGEGAALSADGVKFEAFPSPYSLGIRARATLAVVSTVEELAAAALAGRIVLLRGEIAKEQLMPKNFTFYNPMAHQRIIALLEEKHPLAVIAATGRNPELAGAAYPFPLIEDGDFDIPSVYMTEEEGARLAEFAGREIALESRAIRIPAKGCNVVARKGRDQTRRVVFFAHIDAKAGTPGAIDNATGVVILLLLAELLANYDGELGVEIVALNGEDYYAASGEMLWLATNAGRFDQVVLGVNIDGVGYHLGRTAFSLYLCPSELAATIGSVLARHDGITEGDAWYQSDHSLFVFNGIPALAFTSSEFAALWTHVAHTPKDTPEIVDAGQLAQVASALRDLFLRLNDWSR